MSRIGAALGRFGGHLRLFGYPRRRNVAGDQIASSGISAADLANETLAGLFARPGRMSLTVLGTVIGLGALVATLGLSRTAGNRIVGHFDALAATEIVVSRSATASPDASVLPWDAPERLQRLNGVVAAGNMSTVNVGSRQISTSPVSDPTRQTEFKLTVQAASPGLFAATRADLRSGRFLDEGNSTRADRVAVLGPSAAQKLGISGLEQLPAIRIGDDVYLVVGILDGVARQPGLLGAVIIPEGTARRDFVLTSPELVVVETRIGATKLISQQIPYALRPDSLRGLKVASPPEQQRARDRTQSDLNVLFLMLGGVSLLVGAIGIANVTLVSVIERTGEIGLRRALGASRRHIALQFLLESATMGLVGGILGASLGTLVVIAVAAYQSWTPVLDPLVPLAAPVLGAVVGLVSGTYPALRAARMEPVEALRSGT
jgi:ABC-type antimicrobial peptide transport system permease subunit